MTEEKFQDYVKTRYEPEVEWYTKRGNREKWIYMFFQWGLIIMSALTPILITIGDFRAPKMPINVDVIQINGFQICSITTAFLVAVLAAALKVFHFQENWLDFRATQEKLKTEIHLYTAKLGGYHSAKDARALFVSHVEGIIRNEIKGWGSRMQQHDPVNDDPV